jgi:hypothetical protein
MKNLLQIVAPGQYKTASFIGVRGVLPEETKRYYQRKYTEGYTQPSFSLVTDITEAFRFIYG